jgi:hypothetical protein
MNTNAEEILFFHREKETKKKDRFVKFHPSSKQMILFASASDPFSAPIEPKETHSNASSTPQPMVSPNRCSACS